MRRSYLVIITVSCVFSLLAGCQQQAKVADEPAAAEQIAKKGEPKIEFENTVCDFGKVGPGVKNVGEFKFTNIGDDLLKITKVERCCGVVTTLEKTEYEPGESGILKVRYTTSRNPGTVSRRLYMRTNDKTMPRATLIIKTEVELKVTWEPKGLQLLLKEENAGCPEIKLTSTNNQPFSITHFQSTGEAITAEVDSSVQATQFILALKVDKEKLRNGGRGRINIGLAYPQTDTSPETAMIIFQVVSRFSIRPSMLTFFYTTTQEPIKKSLWVINNYDEDFEIESTTSKEGHITVTTQKKNPKSGNYILLLRITPPAQDTKRFNDTLIINLKDGEKLEVPCQGIYRAPTTKKAGE